MTISAYPKVHNLGHPEVRDIFNGEVVIQEKVDGSQFSFGVHDGQLCCRSKNREIIVDAPDNMFATAVAQAKRVADKLPAGWTFRCEYLKSPCHNHLHYGRIPGGNLVLFDIDAGEQDYCDDRTVEAWAHVLGLECVPYIPAGKVMSQDDLDVLLDLESVLGGAKVEGIVIKNYSLFGRDGKVLMGKYVSPAYRETAAVSWKDKNPGPTDIRERIADNLRTERRWEKAVEHLRDNGELENSPKDIGRLIKEIQKDVEEECEQLIKDLLYSWARQHIVRMTQRGLPEWYKQRLVDQQFGATE